MKNRKIPMRRCVGCMTSKPKGELLRMVADGGAPRFDVTGKANGRGVYLCRDMMCLDKALKKNSISRWLSVGGLSPESKDTLRADFEKLIPGTEVEWGKI